MIEEIENLTSAKNSLDKIIVFCLKNDIDFKINARCSNSIF